MAISELCGSKRSCPETDSSSSKNKAMDMKRMLVEKRLLALESEIKSEEVGYVKNPVACSLGSYDFPNSLKEKKTITLNNFNDIRAKSSVLERAEDFQANLSPNFPSFVKCMLRSHVSGGFWLGLPRRFCVSHLPKHDETVVLVDKSEQEYKTKYLVDKAGLSGGWRGFSVAHKLIEGDVLVFQLVGTCRFKVHIISTNGSAEVDGAISLLNLSSQAKPIHAVPPQTSFMEDQMEQNVRIQEREGQFLEPLAIECHEVNDVLEVYEGPVSDGGPVSDQSGDEGDEFGSKMLKGIRLSESVVEFKDVKEFVGFNIQVNGLIIDSEIPTHQRIKYYELCCSQKMFLHDHLIEGLNCKLVAGIISETINIADAIRAANLSTPENCLRSWDKTLKSFEDLGMAVGFLRARLDDLMDISCKSREVIETKKKELIQGEEEMRILETKLLNVKQSMKKLRAEIESLKVNDKKLALAFKEAASAPW